MGNKISLVLEGGGMRGAYTAGCLSWLLDNKYEFDLVIGISSGSLYGSIFAMGYKETLHMLAIERSLDKENSGLCSVLREGQVVGYDYMFGTILKEVPYSVAKLREFKGEYYAGVYDLEKQDTIWISKDEMDDDALFIKAACTLPIMGRMVKIDGRKYMDGGITTMIPVEKSIELGATRHVVVSTKSANFVRKPQKRITYWAMRLVYRKFPKLIESFEARTEKYYEERELIDSLVAEKKAVNLFPSKELGVSRLGGTKEQYEELFALAYSDCEARKDDLDALFK